MPGTYDDGESFDASDDGDVSVPDQLAVALLDDVLERLHVAGFREAQS